MGIVLKQHNQIAYDKVKNSLAENNMTAIVHPTGTGKTYIALKWIEEHGGKTLYVAPTNHIINQVKETIEEARAKGELTAEEYARYQQIEFKTYTKLMELSKVRTGYETIILDEFHRCGAPEWGKGVQRLLEVNLNAKVIGMTATPIRAVDNKDMADELFQGKVASEMTLEEAVAEGIIKAPIYVNGIYSLEATIAGIEEKIRKLRDRNLKEELDKELKEAKEKSRRHLENAEGIEDIIGKYANKKDGKYIVFCSDIEDMHKKMQEAEKWFQKAGNVKGVKLYKIYHEESEYRNEKTIRQFREEKDGMVHLLFCIDKLNEGVHVRGIDGVIMFRKTESPIVYMQQLGRALSAGNDGTPLVLDLVNNIDSMGYIYEFMRRVEEIRRERGIDDENIGNIQIYENQRDITEVLREITEKLRRDSTSIAIFVKVCEALAKQGFNFKSFVWTKKRMRNGKSEHISKELADIAKEYPETDINKVLEETGVDIHYKIGMFKAHTVQAVTGTGSNLITQEEKQKLIELGIIELTNSKEQWDKKYELLKGLLEADGEYLGLTAEQVKKEQEKFRETGRISYSLRLLESEKNGFVKLGGWLTEQRTELLRPFRGKTIEDIEQDDTIELTIKRKVELLLDLGVRALEKDKDEISAEQWNKKYELLKGLLEAKGGYLGLTAEQVREAQEKFRKTGIISKNLDLPEQKEHGRLGIWVSKQKELLKPYKGKTTEEIDKDGTISEATKRRIKLMLELASDRKTRKEQLIEQWDKRFELLKGLLEAEGEYLGLTAEQVKAEQEKFNKTRRISHALRLSHVEKAYQDIGIWVDKQKELLKLYKGKTAQEIEQDETIDEVTKRRIKLLAELGVRDSAEKKTAITIFIQVCEALMQQGVDLKKVKWSQRIEQDEKKTRRKQKTLADIAKEYPEIDMTQVLKKTGVSISYSIGEHKNMAILSARRFQSDTDKKSLPITEEEIHSLIRIGIIPSEKSQEELNRDAWNKKYELLKGLLEANGKLTIDRNNPETVKLKSWVADQRKKLLRRYKGKTIGEIEQDEKIDAETKRRIRLLFEIGIKAPKPKTSQEIGQATFTAGVEGQKELDEAEKALEEAVQEQKRQEKQEDGGIEQDDNGEI